MYLMILPEQVPPSIIRAIDNRGGTVLECYKQIPRMDMFNINSCLSFSTGKTFWLLVENNNDASVKFNRYSPIRVEMEKYCIYSGIYGDSWTYTKPRYIDGATGLKFCTTKKFKDNIIKDFEELTSGSLDPTTFVYIFRQERRLIEEEEERQRRLREEEERQRRILEEEKNSRYNKKHLKNAEKYIDNIVNRFGSFDIDMLYNMRYDLMDQYDEMVNTENPNHSHLRKIEELINVIEDRLYEHKSDYYNTEQKVEE